MSAKDLLLMYHIRAKYMPRMHGLRPTAMTITANGDYTHLRVMFCYWPVASLTDCCNNEVLSLSAFVGQSDQSLDFV